MTEKAPDNVFGGRRDELNGFVYDISNLSQSADINNRTTRGITLFVG